MSETNHLMPVDTCSICKAPYTGFGNNAEPVNDGRCCDACNATVVIPWRFGLIDDAGSGEESC